MAEEQIKPNDVYSLPGSGVALRIGTGGSGQSGLLRALAEAYIHECVERKNEQPFQIEWYTSDTTVSIDYLKRGITDVGITYHPIAEHIALTEGIADRIEYAWRDHWMLVGPKSNPAKLPDDQKSPVHLLFAKLFSRMEETAKSDKQIRFLSRYDSSACNIAESTIWATIGQIPWAPPVAPWYTMFENFPFQAITAASEKGEYTLTDYGTWCAIGDKVRSNLTIFAKGTDNELDPLLNPAHLLVGTNAKNKTRANDFADWMIRADGGQLVVKTFAKDGQTLYVEAPHNVDPLAARTNGIVRTPDPIRAAANHPTMGTEMLFFRDASYVRVNAVTDTMSLKQVSDTLQAWPALFQTGMPIVDAVLPHPEQKSLMYFFAAERCVLVDVPADKIADGELPFRWAEKWSVLKDAGFERVDAVMPLGGDEAAKAHAVFFSGSKCVTVDVKANTVVKEAGAFAAQFPVLKDFKRIDAFAFKPNRKEKEGFFFSGANYVQVDTGSWKAVRGPADVAKNWSSLKKAGFY